MTASEVANLLEAKPAGDGWVARCPGHGDRRASLSIASGDDGKVLLKCHAGCSARPDPEGPERQANHSTVADAGGFCSRRRPARAQPRRGSSARTTITMPKARWCYQVGAATSRRTSDSVARMATAAGSGT